MAEGTLLFLRILPSLAHGSSYHLFVCLFIHLKALGIEPKALHTPSKHTSTLVSWEMVSLYASDRPRIHDASALASWMWAQQAYATIYAFDVLLESVWGSNRTMCHESAKKPVGEEGTSVGVVGQQVGKEAWGRRLTERMYESALVKPITFCVN